MLKFIALVFVSVFLNSCAVVDSSDFKYLDSEGLELHQLLIFAAEQKVEISLPKSLAQEIPASLFMKPESLKLKYSWALKFPYEWQWGGPAHKDQGLYLFELGFTRRNDRKMLSENIESRIRYISSQYEHLEPVSWRKYVLGRFIVEAYESQQGYGWVMRNSPAVMQHHEIFYLPISNERELIVRFWYNEDWVKNHPEWYERRKALSRRILDTVKISGLE